MKYDCQEVAQLQSMSQLHSVFIERMGKGIYNCAWRVCEYKRTKVLDIGHGEQRDRLSQLRMSLSV